MKFHRITPLIGASAFALFFMSSAYAKDFRLGLLTPPNHSWSVSANEFGTELKSASAGKHGVTVFPAAQLGNEAQMVQQLQTGALDMAFLTMAELSNRSANFGAFYAPYLVQDVRQAGALLRSPETIKMLDALPQAAGVVGIGYGLAGMRQIIGKGDIKSAADLKGKKLRITPFEPIRDFYKAVGAASTPMPVSAVFDALSNGQVDLVDMDLEGTWALKLYQNVDTILLSNHMMFPMVGVVSARVWKELSADDRKLIGDLMRKHMDKIIDTNIVKEAQFEKDLRATGKRVTVASPEFFADAVGEWEKIWSVKAPALKTLRATAAALPKSK